MIGWSMPPRLTWSLHAGDLEIDVHGDFAVVVHARRQVHVHAHVDVGELGVDQRVDADAADAGLEAAGGGGLAVADLERGLLVVHRAELRRLQHRVERSLSTACSRASGSVTEKSLVASLPRLDSGMAVLVVVVVVPVAVPVRP